MKPTTAILTALPAIASLLLSACLGPPAACISEGPHDVSGQTLKVLDHGAFGTMFAEIEPLFESQTGADLVQIEGADAGDALRVAVESRGNPVADLLYGVDNALFAQGADAGIFEPYASPGLARLTLTAAQVDDFRRNGEQLATPADQGFIAVNYDARLAEGGAPVPTTLQDLADPRWASDFVVEDPRLSSPGLGFLIATVATFGENDDYDYLDYWSQLYEGGVLVSPDWTNAYVVHFSAGYGQYEEGFAGDRQLVVSYTTSPAAEAYFGGTEPPSLSLEPANGVFHQVEAVAILRCTQQLPLAQRFVDFVLSDEFQNRTAPVMAVYPVVGGVTLPDAFAQHTTAPEDLQPAPFTSAELHAGIPRWVEAWTQLHQSKAG